MRLPRQPEQTLFDNLSRYRGVRAARRSPDPAYYAGEESDFEPTGCEGPTLRFFAKVGEPLAQQRFKLPIYQITHLPIPLWLIGSAPPGLRSSPRGGQVVTPGGQVGTRRHTFPRRTPIFSTL